MTLASPSIAAMFSAEALIDFVTTPVWLVSTAAASLASFQLAKAIFPHDNAGAMVMHTIVLTTAAIVVVSSCAGAVGLLFPWLLLFAVPAALVATLVIVRRIASCVRSPVALTPARPIPNQSHRAVAFGPVALWLAVLSFVSAHVVLHGLAYFPDDYDCLMYHMPLVDHWSQTHNLFATDTAHWWLPANNELVAFWIVAPFTGDFLIALNNLPLFGLWVAATVQFAKLLGLPLTARHLVALAIISVQPTFYEVDRAVNDLAVIAYWFSALCYALRYSRSRRTGDLILFGISLGMLGGVKYFAIGYAVVLLAASALVFAPRRGWWRATRDLSFAAAVSLPFGAYWYFRNLAVTGSPIYPMGASGPRAEVGYAGDLWSTTILGNRNSALLETAWQFMRGVMGPCPTLCALLTPLVLAILAVWTMRSPNRCVPKTPPADIRRDGKPGQRRRRWWCRDRATLLVVALAGSAAVFVVTPLCVESEPGTLNQLRFGQTPARYGLCFWSTSAIAAVYVARNMTRRWPSAAQRALSLVISGMAVWQTWSRVTMTWPWLTAAYSTPEIVAVALDVALIVMMVGTLRARTAGDGRACRFCVGAAFVAAASGAIALLSDDWHGGYAARFDNYSSTDVFSQIEHRLPDATKICVLDERVYAFYGSRRQFRVCGPRILTSPEVLLTYLDLRSVKFVATRRREGSALDLYAQTPRCVDAFPGIYVPFAGGKGFDVRRFSWSDGGVAR